MELTNPKQVTKSLIKFGVLFFVIVMFATSCDRGGGKNPTGPNNNSSLVGTWVYEELAYDFHVIETVTFRSDGSVSMSTVFPNQPADNKYESGNYTVSGDRIIFSGNSNWDILDVTFILGSDSRGTYLLLMPVGKSFGYKFYKQ